MLHKLQRLREIIGAYLHQREVRKRRHPGLSNRALTCFPEQFRREVSRVVPMTPDEGIGGELFRKWTATPGGHKWLHYFKTYEEVLRTFHDRPVRMLEIGVYKGGSVRMWAHCLPPGSTVVGLDIDQTCKQFEDVANNLHVRIGSQDDPAFLKAIVDEFGPFDFILDDGSHRATHMIDSFTHLFPEGLVPGGQYLVEDTHTNYWGTHRNSDYSFMDFARDLVDVMHAAYLKQLDERFFREGHPERVESVEVPLIAAELEEICFRDSLVLFKKTRSRDLPVSRML